MTKRSSRYDWEAVERDYRTGRYSLSELSAMHGPAKSSIDKRAKRDGWEKDLSGPVRQRTREKVIRSTLSDEALEALEGDDAGIVEEAASLNAAVVKGHRKQLSAWREILDKYTTRLTAQLEADKLEVIDKSGDKQEIDVPLDYIGKSLNAGTQALDRVVRMERDSYGLDDEPDEPEIRRASTEELNTKLERLLAKRAAKE